MPPRKYTEQDKPVFLPTRMPRIMIDYLHLVVRLRRPGLTFATLRELQVDIVDRYLAIGPGAQSIDWKTPRVADRSTEPTAFRQINFQLSREQAAKVDRACTREGVSRATFLYTATFDYLQHIAPPQAIGLA